MEMKIKSQVQFNDDLSQRSNIVSGDSLSNSFAKIHHDLNDYEIAANIAANDRPKNLLYIHDILSDSVSTATEEILGYPLEAGTYVYSAEIYTVQNPSVANVTKIEFLGADGNTVVGTCNIACDTKKEEHINVTLSDEAYYIKYYRDTYSSETVGYLKTSKQMICLPNVYAAFPEYTMYAPSLGETFLEVEDSVKTYDVQDTYDSSSYKAISGKGVAVALGTLDVLSVGGTGKYISAIREEDGKIDATAETMDTTPTANSTVPVTSGGVATDQARQEVEIGAVSNRGAKNLLKFRDNVPSASAGNVYANINADGTLSVGLTSGTTATAQLVFTLGSITNYRDRKLILSGCPAGGNYQSGYALYVSNDGSTAQADTGSSATIPIVTGVTSSVVALMVRSGTTISSELTFRPMVRDASIVDSTFVPYAKTNRELTVAEVEDRAALAEVIDGGAAGTKNHCTQASGSNNPSSARWINIPVSDVGVGQWVMSFGTLTSTDTDDTLCQAICFNSSSQQVSNWVNFKREANTNKVFTTTDNVAYVRLYPANSYAASEGDTVTFTDAMLSPKVLYDADQSYVPYAPALTNIILTPAAIKAVDEGSKNLYPPFETQSSKGGTGVTYSYSGGIVYAKGTKSSSLNYIDVVESSKISELGLKVGDVIKLYNTSDNLRLGVLLGDGTTFDPAITVGNEVKEVTIGTGKTHIYIRAQILSSFTGTVDFSATPMICKKSLYNISPAFVPYALSNPVLTPALIEQVDEGAKNLVDINSPTSLIRFTVSGGVLTSQTGDSRTNLKLVFKKLVGSSEITVQSFGDITQSGVYSYSFVKSSESDTKFIVMHSGSTVDYKAYYDISALPLGNYVAEIYVDNYLKSDGGYTLQNLMVCTKAAWDVSQKFVPYCPTNRELYETKATMDDVYGYGKVIASNSNLNNYTLPGSYYCPNATVAGSLTNTPISDAGFRLVVELLTNTDGRFMQTIHANGNDGAFYQRKQTSQGMSSWYKFEGTAVT